LLGVKGEKDREGKGFIGRSTSACASVGKPDEIVRAK